MSDFRPWQLALLTKLFDSPNGIQADRLPALHRNWLLARRLAKLLRGRLIPTIHTTRVLEKRKGAA